MSRYSSDPTRRKRFLCCECIGARTAEISSSPKCMYRTGESSESVMPSISVEPDARQLSCTDARVYCVFLKYLTITRRELPIGDKPGNFAVIERARDFRAPSNLGEFTKTARQHVSTASGAALARRERRLFDDTGSATRRWTARIHRGRREGKDRRWKI